VKHDAGRRVPSAHNVSIEPDSKLAGILGESAAKAAPELTVNSSHHQAVGVAGDGLRVSARCPEDGVIEALESTQPGQWVVAVQWHPERSYADDAASRALFRALIRASQERKRQ